MGRAHVSTHELVAGRYRLFEVVQRETNRVCWSGEDATTGRPCLVTRIELPEGRAGEAARRAPGRVIRTGETMASLCPGRIAPVLDAVVADGMLWTVTEWVAGVPLGDLLDRRGAFGCARAARVGLELLAVLEAAHTHGVTHGELSPGQVFVREEGSVLVTGFGLAGATLAPRLTAPAYASPEQARDERIGPAADLWTLGAILYTMVEGRPPFRDRGRPEATLKGVDRLPLRTPVRAGPLAQAVTGLLRKNSRERPTRPVVRAALARALAEDPGTAVTEVTTGPGVRGGYAAARTAGRDRSRRTVAAGTALAVVTVAVAVLADLAVTDGLPGRGDGAAAGARQRPRRPPPRPPAPRPPQPPRLPLLPAGRPSASASPSKPGVPLRPDSAATTRRRASPSPFPRAGGAWTPRVRRVARTEWSSARAATPDARRHLQQACGRGPGGGLARRRRAGPRTLGRLPADRRDPLDHLPGARGGRHGVAGPGRRHPAPYLRPRFPARRRAQLLAALDDAGRRLGRQRQRAGARRVPRHLPGRRSLTPSARLHLFSLGPGGDPAVMAHIGYTMMTEQAGPRELVGHLVRAEEVGFDFSVTSDHYFPGCVRRATRPTPGACWAPRRRRPRASR